MLMVGPSTTCAVLYLACPAMVLPMSYLRLRFHVAARADVFRKYTVDSGSPKMELLTALV